jgi:hypothetical protein
MVWCGGVGERPREPVGKEPTAQHDVVPRARGRHAERLETGMRHARVEVPLSEHIRNQVPQRRGRGKRRASPAVRPVLRLVVKLGRVGTIADKVIPATVRSG